MQNPQVLHGLSVISSHVCRNRRRKGSLYAFLCLCKSCFFFFFLLFLKKINFLLCFSLTIPDLCCCVSFIFFIEFINQLLQKLQNDFDQLRLKNMCFFMLLLSFSTFPPVSGNVYCTMFIIMLVMPNIIRFR